MSLFRATNLAIDSAVTTLGAGTNIATAGTAKIVGQLQIPDNTAIRLIQFGWSQDVATATSTLLRIQTTDTGSTGTTAFSTTLVKPVYSNDSRASALTMATTGCSYGNAGITSRTSLRDIHSAYIPQVYVYEWPLGREPVCGNGTTENFVQININNTATINIIWWMVWDEL